MEYSFCESVNAPPLGRWHIRRLTSAGKKLGGGIDTASLCGRIVSGWDLEPKIDQGFLRDACKKCAEIYRDELDDATPHPKDKEAGIRAAEKADQLLGLEEERSCQPGPLKTRSS